MISILLPTLAQVCKLVFGWCVVMQIELTLHFAGESVI